MTPIRFAIVPIAFALAANPYKLSAQQTTAPTNTATLRATVTTVTGQPIVDAQVSAKDSKTQQDARTDSSGVAQFENLRTGKVELRIRRVGFSPVKLDVRVEVGENSFTVRASDNAATLDEVRVVGNRQVTGRIDDFEMRRLHGEASAVVTAQDIEKRHPVVLSQMLRSVSGMRIVDSLGTVIAISNRGQKMTVTRATDKNGPQNTLAQCVVRVSVDGVIMAPYTSIDATMPKDVYGVEVFLGPARMPMQFAGLRTDNWCGLIAIWTKAGQ